MGRSCAVAINALLSRTACALIAAALAFAAALTAVFDEARAVPRLLARAAAFTPCRPRADAGFRDAVLVLCAGIAAPRALFAESATEGFGTQSRSRRPTMKAVRAVTGEPKADLISMQPCGRGLLPYLKAPWHRGRAI